MLHKRGENWGLVSSGLSYPATQLGKFEQEKSSRRIKKVHIFTRRLLPNANKQRKPGSALTMVPFVKTGAFVPKGRLLCLRPLSSIMSVSREKRALRHKALVNLELTAAPKVCPEPLRYFETQYDGDNMAFAHESCLFKGSMLSPFAGSGSHYHTRTYQLHCLHLHQFLSKQDPLSWDISVQPMSSNMPHFIGWSRKCCNSLRLLWQEGCLQLGKICSTSQHGNSSLPRKYFFFLYWSKRAR